MGHILREVRLVGARLPAPETLACHIQEEFDGSSLAIVAATWELHHPAARNAARPSMMLRTASLCLYTTRGS